MFSAERRQEILRLINADSRVAVADLAARFEVSQSSIRRDLNILHRLGLVQRTYGGALGFAGTSPEAPFSERAVSRHEEKERIGRAAARLVQPGATIFVDGGTTTECMLSYLPNDTPLTVVTYGLNIVQRLSDLRHITVVLIGGILNPATLTFGGVFATDSFESYNIRFDKAFMATTGVSAEAGITNGGFEEIPIKRRALRSARETILLADSSKIGLIAPGVVASIDQVQRLITGVDAPMDEIERLRGCGVVVDLV